MKFTRLAAAAALLMTAGFANAVVLNDFTVTPGAYAPLKSAFVADKITGNYVEVITFSGAGTFDVSIKWNAGQFVADDGTNPLNSGLSTSATGTGLGSNYGLYAFFQGSGTAVAGAFTLGTGSLKMYIDKSLDTTFTAAGSQSSSSFWGVTGGGGADDDLIATGSAVSGFGSVSCNVGNNCGSFGQVTTFNLENPAGTSFFTAPNPFYGLSLQSGQFNGFTPAGTLILNGSLDVIFEKIPEPGSVALVGLALVGLGFASRRKAK